MLLVLLFGICIRDVLGYCSGIGANPSFSGPPVVQQVLFIHTLIHTLCFVSRHVTPPAKSAALGIQNIKFNHSSVRFIFSKELVSSSRCENLSNYDLRTLILIPRLYFSDQDYWFMLTLLSHSCLILNPPHIFHQIY